MSFCRLLCLVLCTPVEPTVVIFQRRSVEIKRIREHKQSPGCFWAQFLRRLLLNVLGAAVSDSGLGVIKMEDDENFGGWISQLQRFSSWRLGNFVLDDSFKLVTITFVLEWMGIFRSCCISVMRRIWNWKGWARRRDNLGKEWKNRKWFYRGIRYTPGICILLFIGYGMRAQG